MRGLAWVLGIGVGVACYAVVLTAILLIRR
jgi:hypothetical protein